MRTLINLMLGLTGMGLVAWALMGSKRLRPQYVSDETRAYWIKKQLRERAQRGE